MHFKILFISLFSLAALVSYTSGHVVLIDAVGDAGRARGYGLGVEFMTPRDTPATSGQKDTTVFAQTGAQRTWKGCGRTHMQADRAVPGSLGYDNPQMRDHPNDPAVLIPKMVEQGAIPRSSAGGYLNMTWHQVNADGAGPFRCGIDTTGKGQSYSTIEILQQAPGDRFGLFNDNTLKGVPFRVAIPSDLKCTGTYGSMKNVCLIRCQNPATNGPFGACIPVQVIAPGKLK